MTTKYKIDDLVDADSIFNKPFTAGEFLEMNRIELGWTIKKDGKTTRTQGTRVR